MLQGLVNLGKTVRPDLIGPGGFVVLARRFVVAREQAVIESVPFGYDEGGVGVGLDVFVLDLVVTEQVVDHPAQEGDVRAGAERRVEVRHRCRAGEAGVYHDECGVIVGLGLGYPFEAAGVSLGGVAAHDDDDVGILDVHPVVGHRTASECGGQTGHRWSVSDPGLIVERQHAGAADRLVGDVAGFVAGGGGRQETGGQPAVDRGAGGIFGNEVLVPVVLHQPGHLRKGLVPGDALPLLGAGGAVFRVLEPVGAVDEVHQSGALRAEGAPVHRMVRVAFDVEDGGFGVFRPVPQAVHDQAAAHRAVGAGVAGLATAGQLEFAYLRQRIVRRKTEHGNAGPSQSARTHLEELPSCHTHLLASLVGMKCLISNIIMNITTVSPE